MSSSSGGGGVLAGAFSALFGLDRVFFDARKLKTNLKILSGRIKLLSEKRHARIESIERDVEKLLKELFEETTKGLGGGRRGRRKEEEEEEEEEEGEGDDNGEAQRRPDGDNGGARGEGDDNAKAPITTTGKKEGEETRRQW